MKKYVLIQTYGGYSKNNTVYINLIKAKTESEACEIAEDYDHTFATPLMLSWEESLDLKKKLNNLLK